MHEVRIQAIKLRKQGKSYNEINSELGVSKSTLSGWLRDIQLSNKSRQRLNARVRQGLQNGLIKRNKLQTKIAQDQAKKIRNDSSLAIGQLTERELLLVGVALYWGEGYKKAKYRNGSEITSHQISFVNADPEMIKLFLIFLKSTVGINSTDIVLVMRLYDHINEKNAREYWKNVTDLSDSNFRTSTWLVSGASKRKRPVDSLPYGTLQINVYNTKKFHSIMGYIMGLKKSI